MVAPSRKSDENAKPSFHDAENVKSSFRSGSENVKMSFAGSADLSLPSSRSMTVKENTSSVLDDTKSLLQKTPVKQHLSFRISFAFYLSESVFL